MKPLRTAARIVDFNEITKGVPVHKLEAAFNTLTRGIDWRRSGKPSLRQFYSGEYTVFGDGTKITGDQLCEAIKKVTA